MTTRQQTFNVGSDGAGGTSTISTANSGGSNGDAFTLATGTCTTKNYQASGALKGAMSARVTCSTTTETWAMGWDSVFNGDGTNGLTVRFYFKLLANTSADGAALFAFRNTANANAMVMQQTATTGVRMSGAGGTVAGSSIALSLNTLYRAELCGKPGTTSSNGFLHFAVYAGDSTSALVDVTVSNIDMGTTVLNGVRFGKTGTVGTTDALFDSIIARDDVGNVFIGPEASNVAPSANAGPDQTGIEAFQVVTLAGSGTDTDGTIASYLWTPPSGITLSSNTVQNPTFRAPGGVADQNYTFTLQVTDNGGATGTDTVVISVVRATRFYLNNASVWKALRREWL